MIAAMLLVAAKSDVQVPTVPAGSVGQVQFYLSLAAGLVVALIGSGAIAAFVTARTRKVRQYSDVREDATVKIDSLEKANAAWERLALDAREQAKSAHGELRKVIEDKDRQIADQKDIIADYRRLLDARDRDSAEAVIQYQALERRLADAEGREQELIQSRDAIAERLREAEMHMAETTINPEQLEELRGNGGDRHGLHPLN